MSGIAAPRVGLETPYQSLLDVSQAILQHRDLAGLFRDLSTRLHAILRFDFLNLVLHDAATDTMRLHILETATGSALDVPQVDYPPDESPSGWVLQHQESLVIPDVLQETRWPAVMELLKRNRVVSSCWLPLTTAQHRLGALMFGLEPAAPLRIATGLHAPNRGPGRCRGGQHAELREGPRSYQQQLARERDRLQVLLEITNALVSELDIGELFPTITACLAPRRAGRILQPGAARARGGSAENPRAGL